MSELVTLARPYATAVFKRAKESDSAANWSKKLAFLKVLLSDELVFRVIYDPKVKKADLLELLIGICDEQFDEEGRNFLKLLIDNNRLSLVPAIAELFEIYKSQDEGTIDVDVSTAYTFSKEDKHRFDDALRKAFGKKVNMHIHVDKSLLGGVLVRAGDQVIDGSVRGQLQQLAQRL